MAYAWRVIVPLVEDTEAVAVAIVSAELVSNNALPSSTPAALLLPAALAALVNHHTRGRRLARAGPTPYLLPYYRTLRVVSKLASHQKNNLLLLTSDSSTQPPSSGVPHHCEWWRFLMRWADLKNHPGPLA